MISAEGDSDCGPFGSGLDEVLARLVDPLGGHGEGGHQSSNDDNGADRANDEHLAEAV